MDTNDDVLAHYGIKGMKWGVRRSRAELARASGRPEPSEDVKAVRAAKSKVSRFGNTSALSNQELQTIVTRMNLEQQYSSLAKKTGVLKKGQEMADSIASTKRSVESLQKAFKKK